MTEKRLDRLLSDSGLYTRSEAKSLVSSGAVRVDGCVVRRPEAKFPCGCLVEVEGRTIDTDEFAYVMMHKPPDTVSATEDERYPAVTRLLTPELQKRGLFPVGRLDADVTGLLILTDDGDYAHRVTSPRSETKKYYKATLDLPADAADVLALAQGTVMADGTTYRPAELTVDEQNPCCVMVCVTEGKFHEVKNLLLARGKRVQQLKRIAIGQLYLDEKLLPGEWRKMTASEVQAALL